MTKSLNSDPENLLARLEAAERDLEVEAALERIRRQAMAMQESRDLLDIVITMHAEFKRLGFTPGFFWHMKWGSDGYEKASTTIDGSRLESVMHLPRHFSGNQALIDWELSDEPVGVFQFDPEAAIDYVEKMISKGKLLEVDENPPSPQDIAEMGGFTFVQARTTHGEIGYFLPGPADPSHEAKNILIRFAGAFDLAYRRFEDLKQAEAQAREAQIEASLERVRSSAIAMRHSDDLVGVVNVIFNELQLSLETQICILIMHEPDTGDFRWWSTGMSAGVLPQSYHIPNLKTIREHPLVKRYLKDLEEGIPYSVFELSGETKRSADRMWQELTELRNLPEETKQDMMSFEKVILSDAYLKNGMLEIAGPEPLSTEHAETLQRFAKVVEFSYTRMSDLQKAEEKAREAQIEAALERVRSRTMAMQRSTELADIVGKIFAELTQLDFVLTRCIIWIFDEENNASWWMANPEMESGAESYDVPYNEHPSFQAFLRARQHGESLLLYTLAGKEKVDYDDFLFTETGLANLPEMAQEGMREPEAVYLSNSINDFGSLMVAGLEPLSEENLDIVQRFGRVFQQSYTRFMDVQHAEKQAREAQIEAAMERIRARALAMHSSDELMDVVVEIRRQIDSLGQLDLEASVVHIYPEGEKMFESIAAVRPPGESGEIVLANVVFPVDATDGIKTMMDLYVSDEPEYTIEFTKEMAEAWQEVMLEHAPMIAERREGFVESTRTSDRSEFWNFADFSEGSLLLVTHSPASDDTRSVLRRAASVFDLAYRRFRDLEHAEEQAREARIEVALERIRTQSLRMQHSSELVATSAVFHEQLLALGVSTEFSYVWLPDEAAEQHQFWATWTSEEDGEPKHHSHAVTYDLDRSEPYTAACFAAWESDEPIHVERIPSSDVEHFFATWAELTEGATHLLPEHFPDGIYYAEGYMKYGCFGINIRQEPTEAERDILRRFAVEFERAYARFLDLKQAEAQAREALIEAALERIRAAAMAMHSSDEFETVIVELRRQMDALNQHELCFIHLYDDDPKSILSMSAYRRPDAPDEIATIRFQIPREGLAIIDEVLVRYKSDEADYTVVVDGEQNLEWREFLKTVPADVYEDFRPVLEADDDMPVRAYWAFSDFTGGSMGLVTHQPPDSDSLSLVRRAANVFDLAYRRFKDLKKAEAQAREAQIEAALERVRARTMGMHASQELSDVLSLLFQQFDILGINPTFAHLTLFDEANDTFSFRMTGRSGERVLFEQIIDVNEMDAWKAAYEDWKEGEEGSVSCIDYPQEVVPAVFDIFSEIFEALPEESVMRPADFPDGLFTTQGHCKFGYLGFNHTRRATDDEKEIVGRFAREFGLVYQRFLDLQKAEQQAREAQIEAALERVRARAQAMRTSNELLDVALELRHQMGLIGQRELEVAGIHLYEDDEDTFESWGAMRTPGDEGDILTSTARFPKHGIKIIEEVMALYRSNETDYVVVNEGEKAREWIEVMKKYAPVAFEKIRANLEAPGEQPPRGFWAMADFSGGSLFTVTYKPPQEETRDLLRRAANVFDLAYRRFKDLTKAEAAARESRIEASLERVRAHAMGMQKPGDISDVSILMFDEMEALGIESLRSGISIPLEDERYEFHAATKQDDGSTTLVLGNESVNVHPIIRRAFDGWKEEEEHQVAILEGKDLVQYYHAVFDTMPLPDWQDRMKTGAEARECFATFPFADGWLYTFMRHDITDEEIDIHVRFARAFGLAYQRYHDLKKAEEDYAALLEEKARTEKALTDLRATQKQLVEQEKLASLGSLTAGIAHEIKNPLNFVNNFAEVSEELVEELSEAISSGNSDEAQSILKEITDNAAQIAKHGKRADSIVKAMMQHARGGSSEPEQIKVNEFIEEYVNLSWHGMRARDHGFQAEVIRNYDESIGEIRVQPQEMGRVILNLLNNAFDALKGTDPAEVTVSTQRSNGSVEIRISDNGPGIPVEIREKIFEPFFTTKATGEGTGLGLSLSYDIVTKGHGGGMSVGESPHGGAEFTVRLPA